MNMFSSKFFFFGVIIKFEIEEETEVKNDKKKRAGDMGMFWCCRSTEKHWRVPPFHEHVRSHASSTSCSVMYTFKFNLFVCNTCIHIICVKLVAHTRDDVYTSIPNYNIITKYNLYMIV